jgi:xanthine dehydrogenase YagR molybdenum-binding subunit
MEETAKIGIAAPRIDGRLKVTGEVRYASDMPLADPANAFLATSAIARGRIAGIEETASRTVPSVLEILTHRHIGNAIKPTKLFSDGLCRLDDHAIGLGPDLACWPDRRRHPCREFRGCTGRRPSAQDHLCRGTAIGRLRQRRGYHGGRQGRVEQLRGSGDRRRRGRFCRRAGQGRPALRDAHPTHNPIELFTTSCAWVDGRLTVWART